MPAKHRKLTLESLTSRRLLTADLMGADYCEPAPPPAEETSLEITPMDTTSAETDAAVETYDVALLVSQVAAPVPIVSIAGDSKLENSNLQFKITVTPPNGNDLTAPVTVHYETTDGSATSGGEEADYVAVSGQYTFQPGQPLTKTIDVTVNNDRRPEDNETLWLEITKVQGGVTTNPFLPDTDSRQVEILNNDVVVTMLDRSKLEDAIPTHILVKLVASGTDTARANGLQIKLLGSTLDGNAQNPATLADNDYVQIVNNPITVVSDDGVAQTADRVTIKQDRRKEPKEETLNYFVIVDLAQTSKDAQVTIANAFSTLTIRDDD